MNKKTLMALKLSIKKWEHNLRAAQDEDYDNVSFGWRSCPLCRLFWDNDCDECPVFETTRKPWCEKTPYEEVFELIPLCGPDGDYGIIRAQEQARFVDAVRREVEFLKSLLPKEDLP